MKKKLLDRRGAGIELAILMLVICFSLSILLTSTAAMHYGKKLRHRRHSRKVRDP